MKMSDLTKRTHVINGITEDEHKKILDILKENKYASLMEYPFFADTGHPTNTFIKKVLMEKVLKELFARPFTFGPFQQRIVYGFSTTVNDPDVTLTPFAFPENGTVGISSSDFNYDDIEVLYIDVILQTDDLATIKVLKPAETANSFDLLYQFSFGMQKKIILPE